MKNQHALKFRLKKHWSTLLLLLPAVVLGVVFSYVPMVGILMAFKTNLNLYIYEPFTAFLNAEWTLENFQIIFAGEEFLGVLWNTLYISVLKIVVLFPLPIIVSLLLTEVKNTELSLAGVGYAVFSVAMLCMRLLGDKIVAVLGEEKTLVFGSVIGAIGFLSVIFLENFYAIQLGFVLMGLGLANIVPTIYSLTKYQKVMPINAAVTAITSMGYTGVILGPAVLGFVAHGFGITQVFYLLAVLLAAQAIAVNYYLAKMG